jgi:F0F1-type ATP synthase membrane subunit b/b'
MTQEERAKEIEKVYNDAKQKLEELGKKRRGIVKDYIKELETKKVGAIRASLGLLDNNQK